MRANPQTILVPTDYGELSDAAVRAAVDIAKPSKGTIVLLHTAPVVDYDELRTYAERVIPHDVRVVLRPGTEGPLRAIVRTANDLDVDLIVMGSHGPVAAGVRELTPRPLLTIGREDIALHPQHRILCAVDFSDDARLAFDETLSLARLLNARSTVLHIVRPGSATEGYAAAALDAWLPQIIENAPPVSRAVMHGDVGTLIVHLARGGNYDLIVMGGHGHLVDYVTRHAPCAVLAVQAVAAPVYA